MNYFGAVAHARWSLRYARFGVISTAHAAEIGFGLESLWHHLQSLIADVSSEPMMVRWHFLMIAIKLIAATNPLQHVRKEMKGLGCK